ncbi:MAG: hypothetical protein AAF848_17615, partial [Pseudomonadota bacterium]
FESLSEEQQTAILAAGAAMPDYYGEHLGQAETAALDKMQAADITLKSFADEDYAAFSDTAKPIIDKWLADAEATGLDGQALIDEMTALIEKWNAVEANDGVPWERG